MTPPHLEHLALLLDNIARRMGMNPNAPIRLLDHDMILLREIAAELRSAAEKEGA